MSNETAGTVAERPARPQDAPAGFHYEAVPESPDSWLPAEPGRTCRWRGSNKTARACGQPAVVQRLRGVRRAIWWNYCPLHSYGRWVENGKVLSWLPRENPPAPPAEEP